MKPHFVLLYALWCPHCIHMKPEFELLKNSKGKMYDAVDIESNDMNKAPSHIKPYIDKLNVNGFPFMFAIIDGKVYLYEGERRKTSMDSFMVKLLSKRTTPPVQPKPKTAATKKPTQMKKKPASAPKNNKNIKRIEIKAKKRTW